MTDIQIKSLSVLDHDRSDCLVLTYCEKQITVNGYSPKLMKRVMPIRSSLWKSTEVDLSFVESDSLNTTVLLQAARVADRFKISHKPYLDQVHNSKLIRLIAVLRYRKLNQPPKSSTSSVISSAGRESVDWSQLVRKATQSIDESKLDFDDLSAVIRQMQSLLQPKRVVKKKVSFNDTPQQFRCKKYVGEDEFDAFEASFVRRQDSDEDDDDAHDPHRSEEDFVF